MQLGARRGYFFQGKRSFSLSLLRKGKMTILLPSKVAKMSHLTREQRYTISVMIKSGHSQKEISLALNKDKSVISRELKRNCDQRTGIYNFPLAVRKCAARHRSKPKHIKLTDPLRNRITCYLEQKWSPEQIVGVFVKYGWVCVSHERIYQMIWKDKKQGGDLHKHLRSKGKPYRKRGCLKDSRGRIPNRRDISERPEIVEKRERFGDFEIDTIIGKNHQKAIVTINDRATGLLRMGKVPLRDSESVAQKAIELLSPIKHLVHTITADNGSEFALHQTIAKRLSTDFYFAKPYRSWERGSNENLNRLVRQYIPKGTDFDTITDDDITWIEFQINSRPRKRFDYQSPYTIFKQKLEHSQVAFIG